MRLDPLIPCEFPGCKKEIAIAFRVCNRHWESVPPEDRYRADDAVLELLEQLHKEKKANE